MTIDARVATACHRYSPLRNVSDVELVARCRIGEEDAWSELVVRFSPQVYAITRRAFGLPSHDAEEIFQETFTRACEHLHQLRDGHAFGFWIRRITRRLCIDHLRRPQHPPLTEDDLDSLPGEDNLEELDDAMAVHQALAQLSASSREVVDRFFIRDEPYESIAASLSLPYGTIASRISRGLEKLRQELEVEAERRVCERTILDGCERLRCDPILPERSTDPHDPVSKRGRSRGSTVKEVHVGYIHPRTFRSGEA